MDCTIKGADQLRSYCAADLRQCFRKYKNTFTHNAAEINAGGFISHE